MVPNKRETAMSESMSGGKPTWAMSYRVGNIDVVKTTVHTDPLKRGGSGPCFGNI